jgi:hypothetical protein
MTDEFTCSYEQVVPFECDDLDKFIIDSIEMVNDSEYGAEVLGRFVKKDEVENLYHCFMSLEDWFEKYKH